MFCVIDSSNRSDFAHVLKRIDELRAPGVLAGFCRAIIHPAAPSELDDRTADDAIMLADVTRENFPAGGVTLLNSARSVLVGTAFAELYASGRPVQDDKVFELSRLFLAEDHSHRPYVERFSEILHAAIGYALGHAATHVSLICDMDILALLLSLGLTAVPLGVPVEYQETLCVALLVEISPEAADAMRERTRELGRAAKKNIH